MKIPRRLKEIVSCLKNVEVRHEKRGYVLFRDDLTFPVSTGNLVTLDQWDVIKDELKVFFK
jgi:hypothetical protein